jgi:cyclophilin family peptidyl-prolyl cis-trans isomerase
MRQLIAIAAVMLGLLAAPAHAQNPQVEFRTSAGNFTLELYADKAPRTVANFMQYVKEGHYKETIFHRIIDGFMVQGGGFDRSMREKPTRAPIDNEAGNGLRNEVGTIAMARTNAPHSASAQFFINVANNDSLNFREPTPSGYGYAVFGKVTRGMDVVMKMTKVATGSAGQHQDVPLKPIVINDVVIAPAAAPAAKDAPARK